MRGELTVDRPTPQWRSALAGTAPDIDEGIGVSGLLAVTGPCSTNKTLLHAAAHAYLANCAL